MSAAKLVSDVEASYLLLTARRTLNFVKKAAEDGEEYHDLQPLVDLQCGYAAKLRFKKGPAGLIRPVVTVDKASVHHVVDYTEEGRLQVASEIMGGPVVKLDDETYCLKKDK